MLRAQAVHMRQHAGFVDRGILPLTLPNRGAKLNSDPGVAETDLVVTKVPAGTPPKSHVLLPSREMTYENVVPKAMPPAGPAVTPIWDMAPLPMMSAAWAVPVRSPLSGWHATVLSADPRRRLRWPRMASAGRLGSHRSAMARGGFRRGLERPAGGPPCWRGRADASVRQGSTATIPWQRCVRA